MQTQTTYQIDEKEGLLRSTLRGNVIFSVVSGLFFAFAAGPVAAFIGIPARIELLVIGIILFPFAYIVLRIANGEPLDKKAVKAIIGMDIAWVIASYVFLFAAWSMLTAGGRWFVALQAGAVFLFALFQSIGLRRIQRNS